MGLTRVERRSGRTKQSELARLGTDNRCPAGQAWTPSLIELSANSERSLLESISNHIGAKGAIKDRGPTLPFGDDE